MTVSTTTSTNGKFRTYAGTYAEVINQLDADKIPGHKVKGFAFVSAGACVALVHLH